MRAMIGVSLIAAAAVGPGTPCLAQKVDFSGAKIALAIATPPGGGYDLYGRLVGRFLGAYLPGNPTVVPLPDRGELALQRGAPGRHRHRHHAERDRLRKPAGQCQRGPRYFTRRRPHQARNDDGRECLSAGTPALVCAASYYSASWNAESSAAPRSAVSGKLVRTFSFSGWYPFLVPRLRAGMMITRSD